MCPAMQAPAPGISSLKSESAFYCPLVRQHSTRPEHPNSVKFLTSPTSHGSVTSKISYGKMYFDFQTSFWDRIIYVLSRSASYPLTCVLLIEGFHHLFSTIFVRLPHLVLIIFYLILGRVRVSPIREGRR